MQREPPAVRGGAGGPGYLEPCPPDEALDQVEAAEEALDDDDFLSWPWSPLGELVGPMGRGQVHFVAAFSGRGKTSLLVSAMQSWAREGKRVYYLGLESLPWELRIQWACRELGLHPGVALSGGYRGTARGEELRAVIRRQPETHPNVWFSPERAMNEARLIRCAQEASSWGADVFVIDHIDHIEAGAGYGETVRVVNRTMLLAQDYGLRIVAATQVNNRVIAGDHLAGYGPPKPDAIYMGPAKRMVAHSMLGLYRPLRGLQPGENPKAFEAELKAARSGELPARRVLRPNTMGVVLMKSRLFGEREGDHCFLAVEQGRVSDPAEHAAFPFAPVTPPVP